LFGIATTVFLQSKFPSYHPTNRPTTKKKQVYTYYFVLFITLIDHNKLTRQLLGCGRYIKTFGWQRETHLVETVMNQCHAGNLATNTINNKNQETTKRSNIA